MLAQTETYTDNESPTISRAGLVDLLNEDLAREYQAVIAYVVYSQILKGAAYMNIAQELQKHAREELDHALKLAKQIDYLGGVPSVVQKPVKMSTDAKDLLRFDLDNENRDHRPLPPANSPGRFTGRIFL